MKFNNAFSSFNQNGVFIDDQAVEFGYDYDENGEVFFKALETRSVRPEIQSFEKSCAMDFVKQQLLKEDKKGGFQHGDENLEYDEAPEDVTEILQAYQMAQAIGETSTYFKKQSEVLKSEKEVDTNVVEDDDKA